jgi:hypothetical protein
MPPPRKALRPSPRATALGTLAIALSLLISACAASGPERERGDVATWVLTDPASVDGDTQALEIEVTRLGCASGVTGEVLEPSVEYDDDRIVITVDVAPFGDQAADCQGNDAVPVTVTLDEPIGARELVDGACLEGEAVSTAFCEEPARWPLP